MITYFEKRHKSLSYRILSAFIAFTFIFSLVLPPGYAQLVPQALNLPSPGAMITLTAGFTPAIIKGVTINPVNPFEFNFIIGTGDEHLKGEEFRQESRKMIKYFLAALTVPEKELWVNLSPYEKDRMIPQTFGETEMGKDLLAQDYILKQLTASLMYPEEELGKKFWDKVYKQAKEKYGTTEIPMNTFNKVWIVPQKAVVYESGTTAFVVKSHLKVMLEADYVAANPNVGAPLVGAHDKAGTSPAPTGNNLSISTQIIREVILPAIEQEVNEGKTFANLRQIYNSVILAAWYKQNLRQTLLGQIYVDQGKTAGVDLQDKTVNAKIYDQYLEAFKKGVYNYIKEDYDPTTQEVIPRKYFSGGTTMDVTKLAEFYKAGSPMTRAQQEKLGEYLTEFQEYRGEGQAAKDQIVYTKLAGVEKETEANVVRDVQAWEAQTQVAELARAASPVVSIERFHELLTGALADDGLEVKLRDTLTVRLNENFVETHRDEFLDAIKILRQKILESSGEKLEDGLSYIGLAGVPDYHLEQRDALMLIGVGVILGIWKIFPNPENKEIAALLYREDVVGMFPMIDAVSTEKLGIPGKSSSPVNISLLLETLESGDEAMRKAAANALGSVDPADPRIPEITKALDSALRLKNQPLDVRKAVAWSLERIGGRNFLVTAATSVNEDVRKAATDALNPASSLVVGEGMTEEGDAWVDPTGKNLSTGETSSPVQPFLTPAEFGELVKQGQVKTHRGIYSETLMIMLKNGTSIVGLFHEIEGDFLFYSSGGRFLDRDMEKLDVNAIESITLIDRIPEDVLRSGLDLRNSQEKLRKIFSENEIIFVGLDNNPWSDNFIDLVVNYQAQASEEEKITDVIIPGDKSDPRVEIGAQAGLHVVAAGSYPATSVYQNAIRGIQKMAWILGESPPKIVVYAKKELVAKQQFMPKGDPQDNLYDLFSKGHRVYSLSTKRGLMDGDSPYLDPLGMLAARLRVGITGDALIDLDSTLGKTLTFRYTQRIRRWEWEINEVTFRTADFFDAYLVRPAQPWGGLQVFGDHTVELLAQLDDQRKEILTLFGTEGQRRLMVAVLLNDKPTTPLRPIISGFWIEPGVTLEQVNSFIDGLAENDPWRSGLGLRLTNEIPAKTLDILKPTGGEGPTTPIKMDSLMFGDGEHYYLAMAVYPKEVSPGSTATIAVYADVQMSNLRLHYGFDASRNSGAWQQVDDQSFAEVDSDKPGLRKYQVSISIPQDVTEVNLMPVDGFGNSIKDAMGKDLVINVERRLAEEAMGQAKGIPALDKIREDLDKVVKNKMKEVFDELKRKTEEDIEKSKAELKNELKKLSDGKSEKMGTEKPVSSPVEAIDRVVGWLKEENLAGPETKGLYREFFAGEKAFDNKLVHEFTTKLLTEEKDARAQERINRFKDAYTLQKAFHASWLAVKYNLNKTSWKLVMGNVTRIREDLSGQLKVENGEVLSGEELGALIKDAQMLWEKAEGAGVGTGIQAFDKILADLNEIVKKKTEEVVAGLTRRTEEAIEKSKAELKEAIDELKNVEVGTGIPAFDKIRADLDKVVEKKMKEVFDELTRKTEEAIEKSKAEFKNELKKLSDGESEEGGAEKLVSSPVRLADISSEEDSYELGKAVGRAHQKGLLLGVPRYNFHYTNGEGALSVAVPGIKKVKAKTGDRYRVNASLKTEGTRDELYIETMSIQNALAAFAFMYLKKDTEILRFGVESAWNIYGKFWKGYEEVTGVALNSLIYLSRIEFESNQPSIVEEGGIRRVTIRVMADSNDVAFYVHWGPYPAPAEGGSVKAEWKNKRMERKDYHGGWAGYFGLDVTINPEEEFPGQYGEFGVTVFAVPSGIDPNDARFEQMRHVRFWHGSRGGQDAKFTVASSPLGATAGEETGSPIKPSVVEPDQKGGIDLNPMLMDLQIRRDGNGIPLPLPQQPVENMKIDGFVPVIINITPVVNLPMLLGLADTEAPAAGAIYNQGLSPMDRRSTLKARELEEVSLVN